MPRQGERHDSRRLFNSLFDEIPNGVVVLGRDDRVHLINRTLRNAEPLRGGAQEGRARWGNCRRILEQHSPGSFAHELCQSCPVRAGCIAYVARDIAHDAMGRGEGTRCHVSLASAVGGAELLNEVLISVAPYKTSSEDFAVVVVDEDDATRKRTSAGNRERAAVSSDEPPHGIVGRHPKMRQLLETIHKVGPLDVPVVIEGESGTGKEMAAMALHRESPRSARPIVPVNCGALAEGLLESELFGHVKGAFSGAVRDKKGRFELAHGGTLFLDEVAELSPAMQVKLLRVLQDGVFERVGSEHSLTADARIICATNRNLEQEVARGRFREDLYYRICVIKVSTPALRERRSDIPLIADHLLRKAARELGIPMAGLSVQALECLTAHDWPGNVRELENSLRHGLIRAGGAAIEMDDLPQALLKNESEPKPRERTLTDDRVREALEKAAGNKSKAARLLGIGRATLYRYLSQ